MSRTFLRRALVAGVSLTAAAFLVGCGSSDDHSATGGGHGSPTATVPADSTSVAAHNAADVMFAQMMIPHHQQAVAMADLAATRATDPQVKQLAAQIKDAQAPEIATLSGWLTAWGAPTPTGTSTAVPGSGMPGMDHGGSAMPGMSQGGSGMPGMNHGGSASPTGSGMPRMDHGMPGMMSDADMTRLAAASGRDFDRQFLTMMIAHHEGAITMARTEAAQGANSDAKELAGRISTTQQTEIDTMKDILARI
ncbi:DUF305 domain-containing protein [Micromonospora sp. PLK6-60]|uniref:DUF305 domain-containing protein n=1 Tax=Micromonospora sp. PLK6-60 TaxID=2873383 RepID=UPI001CA624FA|nr:DUF305 domain-containing protein [Micromonospora sp. PLK6-60]MBY8871664.1 DUF305 domain-containing protein [Micromonospora sp. PLK6-60]